MSNYIEYNDSVAFHPGYFIEELIEDSGLTQEDFAKRLGTTPKNLSILVRGEQSLSVDMAMKLSKMLGTSMSYWLNLQNAYDSACAELRATEELSEEREVLKQLSYGYFRDNFGLPDIPRKVDEQVACVRQFLGVASLTVLEKRDMAVSFRGSLGEMDGASVSKANAMVQIAVNEALKAPLSRYSKSGFKRAAQYALTQTRNHETFYPAVRDEFRKAGVEFVVLPNLPGSRINGATKKLGNGIMLMVNDRRLSADSFWFTLFHEIGHVLNGDYGISFDGERGDKEEAADRFAEDSLIAPERYSQFTAKGDFSVRSIVSFADEIDRDPGIVLGRLQNDGFVRHDSASLQTLRRRYKVVSDVPE